MWTQLRRSARGPLRAAGGAGYTVALLAASEVHLRAVAPERSYQLFDRYMRLWSRGVLSMCNVTTRTSGGHATEARTARLVVSNHRSPLDILVLLRYFGGRFLSRADLAEWPILGLAARRAGAIFVERENRLSGASAVRSIRRHLAAGNTITVFPEGTTYPGDEVRPFHPGAFAAVRGLDVEIVPVGLAYPPGTEWFQEGFLQHVQRLGGQPQTPVGVAFGAPRLAAGSTRQLAGQVQEDVQRLTHQARALVP